MAPYGFVLMSFLGLTRIVVYYVLCLGAIVISLVCFASDVYLHLGRLIHH